MVGVSIKEGDMYKAVYDTTEDGYVDEGAVEAKTEVYVASDDVLKAMNNLVTKAYTTTYVKAKDIVTPCNMKGTFRVKFGLYGSHVAMVYGKVVINGVDIGAEQTAESTTVVEKSQDIALGFLPAGTIIEIWTKSPTSPATVKLESYSICGILAAWNGSDY